MTAPVPGDTRDQLAERLQLAVHQAMDVHSGSHEMDECAAFTAALLPTVERIATERAAEALERAASALDDQARACDDEYDERGKAAYEWAACVVRRAATETPR